MKNRWLFLILLALITFTYLFQERAINYTEYQNQLNSFIFKTTVLDNGLIDMAKRQVKEIEINGQYLDFSRSDIILDNLYLYLDELGSIRITATFDINEFKESLAKKASIKFQGETYYLGEQLPLSREFYIFTDRTVYLANYHGLILERDDPNSPMRHQKVLTLFTMPIDFFTTKYQ
jgi:hypothetical protein